MELALMKSQLHEYIENADEPHLAAIIEFVQQEKVAEGSSYDEETMAMLYDRRKNHLNGVSKSYGLEESRRVIRACV
jgi:predicted house-cleaning noncanonical NTP pyrophosphatase (MazG superfamily)